MQPIEKGVIVGTSRRQEWLLPWWYMHFRMHNPHPIIFVDFGDLSEEALNWCQRRGQVIELELDDSFMSTKEEVNPETGSLWEKMQPNVWSLRFTWYKKPFALQLSSFDQTLWLDLDCQVRGSIEPLFCFCENEGGFAVAPEHELSQILNRQRGIIASDQTMYNAGVIVYSKDSLIVQEWAHRSLEQNHLHCSDQQLMSRILNSKQFQFSSLPSTYNYTADQNFHSQVVILHRWGDEGKRNIQKMMDILTREQNYNFSFNDLENL